MCIHNRHTLQLFSKAVYTEYSHQWSCSCPPKMLSIPLVLLHLRCVWSHNLHPKPMSISLDQGGGDVCGFGVHSGYPPYVCWGSGEAAYHTNFRGGPDCVCLLRLVCALVSRDLGSLSEMIHHRPEASLLVHTRPIDRLLYACMKVLHFCIQCLIYH